MSHHGEAESTPESTRRFRAWLVRFGVAFACLCILLAAEYMRRVQVQRAAGIELRRLGVHVSYEGFDEESFASQHDRPEWQRLLFENAWLGAPDAIFTHFTDSRVDDRAADQICKFPEIKALLVSRATISPAGFEKLGQLRNLVCLDVSATNLGDDELRHLRRFPKLKRLSLAHTAVTDFGIKELSGIQSLEVLDLTETRVTSAGVAKLQTALPKARIVWRESPTLEHWRACAEITQKGGSIHFGPDWVDRSQTGLSVSISRESFAKFDQHEWRGSLEEVSLLPDIQGLQRVFADSELLGPEKWSILGKCPDLNVLHFDCKQISDADLAHICEFPNLAFLYLSGSPVSDVGIALLKGKHLKSLDLSGTELSDEGLKSLEGMATLERLIISSTIISDAGMASLAKLVNLKSLTLSNTAVGDNGLAHLRELRNLDSLTLDKTLVTDAGLDHLRELSQLKYLRTNGAAGVTPEGIRRLKSVLPGLR